MLIFKLISNYEYNTEAFHLKETHINASFKCRYLRDGLNAFVSQRRLKNPGGVTYWTPKRVGVI